MEDSSQKILRKRKPFRLLSKLGAIEVAQFREFLESTFANPKPDRKLIAFYDLCYKIKLWNSNLDKAGFEKVTGLQLTDNAFDKLVSNLYGQLMRFAGMIEYLQTPSQHAPFAMKHFARKDLEQEELSKIFKEGKRELNVVAQDEIYFRTLLELELVSAENTFSRSKSPEERGLLSLHTYLDSYYFILKMRLMCATANAERIFGDAMLEELNPEMRTWLHSTYHVMPTLAKVYYHALQILTGNDDSSHVDGFQKQLEIWEGQSQDSGSVEFLELKGYLLNYYLRKLNSSDLEALSQAHRFYCEALSKGWLHDGDKLHHEHFKNILTIKCRLKLLKDARLFYDTYRDSLLDNLEGAVLEYTGTVLQFFEQRYVEVIPKLEALIEAKGSIKTDQFYGLDMRCILLKTYYEYLSIAPPKTWDLIDDKMRGLLHAFPAYIARKNLPRTTQLRFDNFRNTMYRLYTISYDTPNRLRKAKMEELLIDLKSSSNLPDIGWFIQKAESFLK